MPISHSHNDIVDFAGERRNVKVYADLVSNTVIFDGLAINIDPVPIGALLAEVAESGTNNPRVKVSRTDITDADGNPYVIFERRPAWRFYTEAGDRVSTDTDGPTQGVAVVDYLNAQFQLTGQGETSVLYPKLELLDFVRDEGNTSILMSNGDHYGVNSIRAIEGDDGFCKIVPARSDTPVLYSLAFDCAQINGTAQADLTNCVNSLNALFTISALGGTIPAPVYTQADGVDLSWNSSLTIDPTGDGLHGKGDTGTGYHGPRVWTTETINEPGEYFTFEAKNVVAGGGPLLGIGLYSVSNGDLAEVENDLLSNSGHHGFFFSNWLYNYGTYTAPWTTYGSHSSLGYGPGWAYGDVSEQFRYSDAHETFRDGGSTLFKCGITDEGFVGVYYYDVEIAEFNGTYGARTNEWVLLARSTTPVPAGEFGLMVKIPTTSGQIMSAPRRFATDAAAPTLYYRYIESPDGQFHYPLFSSTEEANYIDTQNGGIGESDANIYVDDPTNTTWYSPVTGFLSDQGSAPVDGGGIVYTEIATDADSGFVPSQFSVASLSVMEGQTINYQTQPVGTNYVTTITGLPTGLAATSDGRIIGDAPYVSEDTTHAVDVARTNEFGTSIGALTLIVADNLAASAISGWTIHQGNTLAPNQIFKDEYSVLQYDTQVSPGEEITWSHANSDYMIGGFLNPAGESLKTTNDLALSTTAWGVSFSIWPTWLNHLSQKDAYWDNHDVGVVNDSEEWTFKYCLDGYVEMYKGGVLLATSVSTFSGAQTFTVATPQNYSLSVYVPTLTIATSVFAGDPPAGFESAPITYGSMDDATTLGSDSVVALDMELGVGERLVVTKSFVETNMLPNLNGSLDKNYFGVPGVAANWSSVDLHSDFDAVTRLEYGNFSHKLSQSVGNSSNANHLSINSTSTAHFAYAIEWDGTDLHVIAHSNEAELNSEYGVADGGTFDRVFTYSGYDSVRAGNLPLVFATKSGGGMTLTTTGFSKVSIPAAPAGTTTSWTKAIDFSGGSERMAQEGGGNNARNPLRQVGTNVSMPISGTVSSSGNARPFATAIVFRHDGNASDQYIWGQVEGSGTGDDNIALKVDASGDLLLKWGRGSDKSMKNCGAVAANTWYGVYVDYNGFTANSPTVSEMADAFRIKIVALTDGAVSDITGDWNQAARNNRTVGGNFFVGGRDAGKSFHGKVASMVVTALKAGDTLPTDAEVAMMVRDPEQWLTDYKIGNSYRVTGSNFNNAIFSYNDIGSARNTQVWLMGDGTSDAYAVIRNQVAHTDQNESAIRMTSMVSNDVQTVTITGLS